MTMHSRQSLYATHGISARDEARLRLLWKQALFLFVSRLLSAVKAELEARHAAAPAMEDRMLRDIGNKPQRN
jgi:hypothetical protein